MKMKRLFFCAILLLGTILLSAAELLPANSLSNKFGKWMGNRYLTVKAVDNGGQPAVVIGLADGERSAYLTHTFDAKALQNSELTLLAKLKVNQLGTGKYGYSGFLMMVSCVDEAGKRAEIKASKILLKKAEGQEQSFTRSFKVPANAAKLVVYCGYHTIPGEVEIRQISLTTSDGTVAAKAVAAPVVAPVVEKKPAAVAVAVKVPEGRPILINGDFEKKFSGWMVDKSTAGEANLVPGPQGGTCLEIIAKTSEKNFYVRQDLPVELIKGKELKMTADLRAENIANGKFAYSQGRILVQCKTTAGKIVEVRPLRVELVGTFPWHSITRSCIFPKDIVSAELLIGTHSITGKMYVDNLKLEFRNLELVGKVAEGVTEYSDKGKRVLKVGNNYFWEEKIQGNQPGKVLQPSKQEQERGFSVFIPREPEEVVAGRLPEEGESPSQIKLRVARGQCEPFFFAVSSWKNLKTLSADISDFAGKKGVISRQNFDLRQGRNSYWRAGGYCGERFKVTPRLLVKKKDGPLAQGDARLFWFNLRIPETAKAGVYQAKLQVTGDGKVFTLPMTLEVLNFTLPPAEDWMVFYYSEKAEVARKDFKVLRDYGVSNVILAGMNEPVKLVNGRPVLDLGKSDAMIEAVRQAGFTGPLIYNPYHDRLMTLLIDAHGLQKKFKTVTDYSQHIYPYQRDQIPAEVAKSYQEVIRQIYQHAAARKWPKDIYFYAVDEPKDGGGWRMPAAQFEHELIKKAIPNAKIFCTAYFQPTLKMLEPNVDVTVLPFTELINNANLYKQYLDGAPGKVKKAWGIDWLGSMDDFNYARKSCGFLPARCNLDGMSVWTYYTPRKYVEYSDLRGGHKNASLMYFNEEGDVPTITLEAMRAGIDDWRYFCAAKRKIAAMPAGSKKQKATMQLQKILDQVGLYPIWDMNYRSANAIHKEPSLNPLREKLIDLLLSL